MKIGLLGPIATKEVAHHLDRVDRLPPGNGGYPVSLLADELVSAGHDVRVWTLDPTVDRRHEGRGDGLRITYLPYRTQGRARDLYSAERTWLDAALQDVDIDVDVLNAHWSYEYAMAARRRPEPTVVTVHDWAPAILRFQTDLYRLVRLGMYAGVHVRRPAMTTPSPYVVGKLRRLGLGTPMVVPNGVRASTLVDAPRTGPVGGELLAVVMGFSRRKNSGVLLEALGKLRAQGHDVRLTLIGEGHGPGDDAERWAADRGLTDGVTFRGMIPYSEVLDAMDACDVLVHPAREESFGMVLVEAMARGAPVVAGHDAGAVPWVLGDGAAGVLVDVTSPASVADGIASVLDDRARYAQLSAAGLARVRDAFVMPVVAAGYMASYAEVLDGGASGT